MFDAFWIRRSEPAKTGMMHINKNAKGTSHCVDKIFIQSPIQIKDISGFFFQAALALWTRSLAHVVFVIGSRMLLGEGVSETPNFFGHNCGPSNNKVETPHGVKHYFHIVELRLNPY
jgi:hypothetical protein